ncbi:hypothetical protein TruAng_003454 [Truncatella angustata]|nr:hypothetical protein TruAng_003454 [Truncatella angustata]
MKPNSSSKARLLKQLTELNSELGPHWSSTPRSRSASDPRATPDVPKTSPKPPSPPPKKRKHQDTAAPVVCTVGRDTDPVRADRPPSAAPPSKAASMSQRNRGQRSANRNSEGGEEYFLWQSIQSSISSLVPSINESSQNVQDIADQDKQMVSKQAAGDFDKRDLKGMSCPNLDIEASCANRAGNRSDLKAAYEKIDSLFRAGVKVNEKTSAQLKEVIEKLHVLSALQKAKEESQEPSLSRSATQRAKESAAASSSVYDFDGSGDSPVPSPNPSVARRMGGSTGSKGDRGSVPPSVDRSTPVAKAGSAEPQGPGAALARSKVIFSKGEEVAFKPKPQNSEPTDWILGVVQDVRGEGKSRRYRVLDADVDDTGKQKEFRSSASSMIGIPKEGTVLPGLDPGKTVLALYPNTTTLYKAEVHGMADDGKVNLKFEGEESSNTVQAVARRYVVEYRA